MQIELRLLKAYLVLTVISRKQIRSITLAEYALALPSDLLGYNYQDGLKHLARNRLFLHKLFQKQSIHKDPLQSSKDEMVSCLRLFQLPLGYYFRPRVVRSDALLPTLLLQRALSSASYKIYSM